MIDPDNPLPEPGFLWRRLMAFAVVAASLGLNIKTIENHLSRARKILREKLKKIR